MKLRELANDEFLRWTTRKFEEFKESRLTSNLTLICIHDVVCGISGKIFFNFHFYMFEKNVAEFPKSDHNKNSYDLCIFLHI